MGSYHELTSIPTIGERLEYLRRCQTVGQSIWEADRVFNQTFYHSKEWRSLRHDIIVRDNGWDLAVPDYPISDRPIVHHIDPITMDQLSNGDPSIFDPENLILCSHLTHNYIHYGRRGDLPWGWSVPERSPNDTCPWKS